MTEQQILEQQRTALIAQYDVTWIKLENAIDYEWGTNRYELIDALQAQLDALDAQIGKHVEYMQTRLSK